MKRRRKQNAARPSRSKEAVVLIPLKFNDDTQVPKELILSIFDEIYVAFAGWTDEGTVRGAYRMAGTGEKRVEECLKISIVLEEGQIPALEALIGTWCKRLGQEVILLKISDYTVKFIPPPPEG
jgi:hypothetical protein